MFAFNANKCVICYLLSNLKSEKITVENIFRICHSRQVRFVFAHSGISMVNVMPIWDHFAEYPYLCV